MPPHFILNLILADVPFSPDRGYPDQLKTMQDMFDDLASSMVEADEPTATPTIFPPTDFLELDVNEKAYLTSCWCGNDGQQPLYYDPCTSGPCK